MELSEPRWKGKGFADIAAENPMSEIVKQLQSSLSQSKARAMLSGSIALLETTAEVTDLLNRSCFGRQITTSENIELWDHMKDMKATIPELYLCYVHLRRKNWVVRAGAQYGVDFVAYRHHPALVHSEYAVIVLSEDDNGMQKNARLSAWSDLQCSLRVTGSVAKTLLILFVNSNGSDATFPSCLERFIVEERTITRWVAEECREEDSLEKDGRKGLNE